MMMQQGSCRRRRDGKVAVLLILLLAFGAAPVGSGESAVKPVNLEKLNSANDEDDPFVTSDHLALYYAAKVDGKWEVFTSRRSSSTKPFAAGKPLEELL